MASLETLRKAILLTLYDNRALLVGVDDSANRRELAGILTDAVAIHIATEAMLEATLETNRQQIHEAVSNEIPPIGAFADEPIPAGGGFGARHKDRPGQTVADAEEGE